MLTVDDLQGSARRRTRERTMRLVFQLAAVTSVVVSALILFVLFRGAIQFLNSIDCGLRQAVGHRVVPSP